MKIKKIILVVCVLISSLIIFNTIRCNNEIKIEVTKKYIINEHWDKYNHFISVEKLQLKDSTTIYTSNIDIITRNFNHLETDSSFMYYAYILNAEKQRKVIFNEYNEFYWYSGKLKFGRENSSLKKKYKKIHNLENNTWYKFSNLKSNLLFFIYVYIDNNGISHQFTQNLSNY